MLRMYFGKYVLNPERAWYQRTSPIRVEGFGDEELQQVAEVTEGFSGREIAKLCIAWQAAAYGTADGTLTPALAADLASARILQHRYKERWGREEMAVERVKETGLAAEDVLPGKAVTEEKRE